MDFTCKQCSRCDFRRRPPGWGVSSPAWLGSAVTPNGRQDLLSEFGAADDEVRKVRMGLVVQPRRPVQPGGEHARGASHRYGGVRVPLPLTARVYVGLRIAADHG